MRTVVTIACLAAWCWPASAYAEQDEDDDRPRGLFEEYEEQEQEPEEEEEPEPVEEQADEEQEPEPIEEQEQDEGSGPARRLSPRWFWSTIGLGIMAGTGATICGVLAAQLNNRYLEEQRDHLLRMRGMRLQLATNVLAGVGGALAITAVVLAVLTDWSAGRESHQDEIDPDNTDQGEDEPPAVSMAAAIYAAERLEALGLF